MATLDKAALVAKVNQYLTTNGFGLITGAQAKELVIDLLDSVPNLITGSSQLGLSDYDPGITYYPGRTAIYNGQIYKAGQQTTGTFNAAHWQPLGELLKKVVITINRTEMLALNTLNDGYGKLAIPGVAGKVLQIVSVVGKYDFDTNPYEGVTSLDLYYADGGIVARFINQFVIAGESKQIVADMLPSVDELKARETPTGDSIYLFVNGLPTGGGMNSLHTIEVIYREAL